MAKTATKLQTKHADRTIVPSLQNIRKHILEYTEIEKQINNITFVVVAPFSPFVCKVERAEVLVSYDSAKL